MRVTLRNNDRGDDGVDEIRWKTKTYKKRIS